MYLSVEQGREILLAKSVVSRPSFTVLYAFCACLFFNYTMHFIGTVFVGEILMLIALPVLLFTGMSAALRYKVFRRFILLSFIMFLGYFISDIVVGNSINNMIRGWARIAFLLVDILFFSTVMVKDRRCIWWGVLGFALSKLFFQPTFDTELSDIKFRTGWVVLYGSLCLYRFFPRWMGALTLCCAGGAFLIEGARSLGGGPFVAGGLVLFMKDTYGRNIKVVKLFVVGLIVIVTLAAFYGYASLSYTRKDSTEGRMHGLHEGVRSVLQSPIIGAGSWNALGRTDNVLNHKKLPYGGHSCILQSWVEGGILSALFFMFYFVAVVKGGMNIMRFRPGDYISAVGLIFMILEAWNIINSPFGGDKRVPIGFTVGLLTYFEHEKMAIENFLQKKNAVSA